MNKIINAISVDVEDYFQVSAFEDYIPRENWDKYPCNVEANIMQILLAFKKYNVKGTFFILGWIAERYPDCIKQIAKEGHEIASHGYSHIRINQQTRDEFYDDIVKTKSILEDLSNTQVLGYRAASYSITERTLWAHEVIDKAGYLYSSSVYPIRHDLYGIPDASRFPYKPENTRITEIPISTIELMGKRLPCGGGGYFRLFPYLLSSKMIAHINNKECQPCIFYFHPWELDLDQPTQRGLDIKTRFRHYYNIKNMAGRLNLLLDEFNWGTIKEVYLA